MKQKTKQNKTYLNDTMIEKQERHYFDHKHWSYIHFYTFITYTYSAYSYNYERCM